MVNIDEIDEHSNNCINVYCKIEQKMIIYLHIYIKIIDLKKTPFLGNTF